MAKTFAELREMHKKMLQEDKASPSSGGGVSDWATFEDGDNFIRFLPGKDNPFEFFVEGAIHKYQDDEGRWPRHHQA